MIATKTDIDVSRLRSALHYDPETGILTWRVTYPSVKRCAGDVAGYLGNKGYIKIGFDGRYWLAHRLAWAIVHGILPAAPQQIDHINRIRHDNRLSNLRVVSPRQNQLNIARPILHEFVGTTFVGKSGKWQAQCSINGRKNYLGTFDTRSEAHAAYRTAAARREICP